MSGQEIIIAGVDASQAIIDWDPSSGAALPAYLQEGMEDLGSNIPDRMTVPSLSYEGKTWQIVKDGNKTKLQSRNADGDLVPVPVMRVVVLNFNAERGRAYYPGAYDPSKTDRPTCWSADGVAPDASVQEKQASACKTCPMAIKGSKIADGKEMVACAQHRMIAVVPGYEIGGDPLRLKIAVTSDYDKEIVEHGWFAFRQYVDFLKSRGINHTGGVITKIKFDVQAQYPKLLFALDRLLSAEEFQVMKQQLQNPKVAELLAEKWTAAGSAGTPINDSDIRPHGLEGAYADGWVAHPGAAGYSYKGQEVLANEDLAARYPAPEPKPAPPAPTPAAPPPAPAPVAAPEPPPPSLRSLAEFDGWVQHPDSPPHGYKGSEVLEWPAIEARYAEATPTPAVPAAPPPAPEPEPVAPYVPRDAAIADGWVQHPDSPPHGYKGSEVLAWDDIDARYAGNAAPASTAPAPQTTTAPSPASDAAPAADAAGVLQDPAIQNLLSQWTS